MYLYHYTQILLYWILLFHVHVPLMHGTLLYWILLHEYSVLSYFMFLYHCYIGSYVYMRGLFLYSCNMDHSFCYMDNFVFLLYDYFLLLNRNDTPVTGH